MTIACVLCCRPWSVSKSGTWISSSGGPHVDAVHGGARPARTGCPGACCPSSVYHTRPGGWRESRGVALGAASCMRRVRDSSRLEGSQERAAAVQRWVSSITSLTGCIVGSEGSSRGMSVPFVPYRQWAVVINDPAHRRATLS